MNRIAIFMIGFAVPTAASALELTNLPTMILSVALYINCNKFPRTSGMVKPINNFETLPLVISFVIIAPLKKQVLF
jgi:hypothetical protein